MKNSKDKIKILIITFAIICICLLAIKYLESNKVNICISGWTLKNGEKVTSTGNTTHGPWILVENGNEFYKYMTTKGVKMELNINDLRYIPKALSEFSIAGNDAIRIEVDPGHYLFVVKKNAIIAVWSISL
jgi:hypothetical protein